MTFRRSLDIIALDVIPAIERTYQTRISEDWFKGCASTHSEPDRPVAIIRGWERLSAEGLPSVTPSPDDLAAAGQTDAQRARVAAHIAAARRVLADARQ